MEPLTSALCLCPEKPGCVTVPRVYTVDEALGGWTACELIAATVVATLLVQWMLRALGSCWRRDLRRTAFRFATQLPIVRVFAEKETEKTGQLLEKYQARCSVATYGMAAKLSVVYVSHVNDMCKLHSATLLDALGWCCCTVSKQYTRLYAS
jgi:hypothetical protein